MTRSTPAIPVFGDAYLADTRHLSLEQHGAYLQLLMIAWRSPNCALPDDDVKIARMLGVTPKKWGKLKPEVMAFWTLTDDGWQQKRLLKERRFVAEKSKQNADAANTRWEANRLKNNDVDNANAVPKPCGNDAPPPPPKKSSEANASGGEPPDPVKELFDVGVSVLTASGQSEKEARSLIGKWRKDTKDDGQVLAALLDCRTKCISSPVEWLTKRFKGTSGYVSASGFQYRGGPEEVMRQAHKRADWDIYWQVQVDQKQAAGARA